MSNYKQLTYAKRSEIKVLDRSDFSQQAIGKAVGVRQHHSIPLRLQLKPVTKLTQGIGHHTLRRKSIVGSPYTHRIFAN